MSQDYGGKAFIAVDFSQQTENRVVTLGEDNRIIIWLHEKMKCLATDVITLATNQLARHISFSPQDDDTIIVTGKDVFKYYKVTD